MIMSHTVSFTAQRVQINVFFLFFILFKVHLTFPVTLLISCPYFPARVVSDSPVLSASRRGLEVLLPSHLQVTTVVEVGITAHVLAAFVFFFSGKPQVPQFRGLGNPGCRSTRKRKFRPSGKSKRGPSGRQASELTTRAQRDLSPVTVCQKYM